MVNHMNECAKLVEISHRYQHLEHFENYEYKWRDCIFVTKA